jgi:Uma2 family endonuclease
MSPTGGLPGYAAGEIVDSLRDYARHAKTGYAIGDNVGFVVELPNRDSFSPDAAFYTGELTMKFVQGAPVFAVEVRSEGDYGPAAERAMAEKRVDYFAYFAAGTRVVWDVDLQGVDVVRAYRFDRPAEPVVFRRGERANAEPALPGWSMAVDDLFP